MKTDQLPVSEYSEFNATYIRAAGNVDMIEELEICLHDFIKFVQNIPMEKFDYRYDEGKWTIKEIIQQLYMTRHDVGVKISSKKCGETLSDFWISLSY